MDVNEAADHIFGLVLMNDWSGKHASCSLSPFILLLNLPCCLISCWFLQLEIFRHGNMFLLGLSLEKVLVRTENIWLNFLVPYGKPVVE